MPDFEDINQLQEELDTDDVGQKRYLMYQIFDLALEKLYELKDVDLPDAEKRVEGLKRTEGYIYKLSQDFLTSSSTLEKEKRLEKIIDHVERKI